MIINLYINALKIFTFFIIKKIKNYLNENVDTYNFKFEFLLKYEWNRI